MVNIFSTHSSEVPHSGKGAGYACKKDNQWSRNRSRRKR